MASSRIVVTGATGFIGRWSVPALLRRGYEVHAVGSPRLDRALPAELVGATLHNVDLLDWTAADRLLDEVHPSHLLHFAWYTVPDKYWTALDNFAWTAASLYLVQRFRAAGGRRVVVAGSCAEYDWDRAKVCDEHSTPPVLESRKPVAPYAICKASLQRLLESYGRVSGLSVAWGRIFWQYGPYESKSRLVPSIISALLQGQSALCSDGRQVRSFLYSQDVGEAFATIVDSQVEGPVNIGADGRTSVAEMANTIGRLIGRPELVVLGAKPLSAGEPPYLVPDVSRLCREVGWHPTYDLETGLAKTIEWWRRQVIAVVPTNSTAQ